MRKPQTGWRGRGGWALLLAAGILPALSNAASAQEGDAYRADGRQEVYQVDSRVDSRAWFARGCCRACCGGPYKGFYPCNGKTPYYGGACYVYGDAPLYSAPADYGKHCAAWCP